MYKVLTNLNEQSLQRWQKQFVTPGKSKLESIWRRHQYDWNAELSGWRNKNDARRRVIHYLDQYQMISDGSSTYSLVISDIYLWILVSLPTEEITHYIDCLEEWANIGKWTRLSEAHFKRNNLIFSYTTHKQMDEDLVNHRSFPPGYKHLELTVKTEDLNISSETKKLPWEVLSSSYRHIDPQGNPTQLTNFKDLEKYWPFQVELGCGPSIETGIPPLHYLHDIYKVMDRKGHFKFSPPDDSLMKDILIDTPSFYHKAGQIYAQSLIATPTKFYQLLKRLHEKGIIVGDIITNSIDNLCLANDLPEYNVRKYHRSQAIPKIDFHSSAKTLLVVGSHADRRLVRKAAREKGMQIIFVDPQGFREGDTTIPYPLESPHDDDLILPMTAAEFARKWEEHFPV